MSAVLITGMSGAGKSTIAAVLARRGLTAIDSDSDPLLARMVDAAGNVVEDPPAPDLAWLARHSWAWDPARLDEQTMLARLDEPGRDNEWGRIGDTREFMRRRLPGYQDQLRAAGVIPINATLPVDQVADVIVSRAAGSSAASPPSSSKARPR
jgi:hypothetical protein